METESDGRIRRFLEKPKADEITCNTINAGTYILEPKVLDFIPAGENHSFEYGLFPELLKRNETFFAHVPHANLLDRHRHAGTIPASASGPAGESRRPHSLKERRGDFDSATAAEIDELQ